jgi:thioredoxin 1
MKARTIAGIAVLVMAAALLGACNEEPEPGSSDDGGKTAAEGQVAMTDIDSPAQGGSAGEGGRAELESGLPRLIDLGADKCVPCKMMAPILEEMRVTFEGQLAVEFIDVWKDRNAGSEYGVQVIPTQIFYGTDGTELFRHQGFFSREDILAKWKEFGYEFEG